MESQTNTREKKSEIKHDINVGMGERLASILAGGLLGAYVANRGKKSGFPIGILATELVYRGFTGHCPLYSVFGVRTAGPAKNYKQGIRVSCEIAIQKPRAELYRFWRNFENLPKIMRHVKSVKVVDNTHSHWIIEGPAHTKLQWDAEIINDFENELITWQSLGKADVINAGSVSFQTAPGGKGTIVKVVLRYDPPGGSAGAAIARLLGDDPEKQIKEDLKKFNEIMGPAAEPSEDWHLAEFKSSKQDNGG